MTIDPEQFRNEIKSKPHWKIIVSPTIFDENMISSLKECNNIISKSQVRIGLYEFPENRIGKHINIKNSIVYSENDDTNVQWAFFTSGQFVYLSSFFEDNREALLSQTTSEISGFTNLMNTIYKIGLSLEFIVRMYSNLREKINTITITYHEKNINKRKIYNDYSEVMFRPSGKTHTNEIEYKLEISLSDLFSDRVSQMVKILAYVFEQYQINIDEHFIRTHIDKFFRER
ncbi:hypothetical protein EHQ96_00020 [Leptospira levettii]|uniref:hypothetical protein n=1 Tax=Leptospira levettii TaxID=2023178 RepID=UPI001083F9A6|nr:hypothetical protein [Leptospira levettii]TGM73627.1 hypothetical protein EHQ96_00020 [Leptospira levettii]